jgi:hypothetical protein
MTSNFQRKSPILNSNIFCETIYGQYEKIRSWPYVRIRDSVVGIATGYWLDDREVGVRAPVGSIISLLHIAQTGSGAHPSSHLRVPESPFPGVKQPVPETESSTTTEVKKIWVCISTPPCAFMA